MKKIVIEASSIAQANKSGVGYFAEHLSEALESAAEKHDAKIHYFWLNFLGRKQPDSHLLKRADEQHRLKQLRLIAQKIYAKLIYARIAPPLSVGKFDWGFFPNFYLWPLLGVRKRAVIIHDLCFMRYPEYVEEKNLRFLNAVAKRAIQKADLLVVNSQFTHDELVKLAEIPDDRIVSIDIPVDPKRFDPKLNLGTKRLAKRYGINKPYILTLGTLEPRKNLELLIEAYVQLPADIRSKYSLVLAGKWGWKFESLKSLIEKRRAEGYDIITTNYIDHGDNSTIYRNASAYAITTHYEGFGMPLLEALHCGIPAVAVDIPVLREVGGDACLWAESTTDSVSDNLKRLLTDKKLGTQLAKKGPLQSKKFSWEKTADKLLKRMVG